MKNYYLYAQLIMSCLVIFERRFSFLFASMIASSDNLISEMSLATNITVLSVNGDTIAENQAILS